MQTKNIYKTLTYELLLLTVNSAPRSWNCTAFFPLFDAHALEVTPRELKDVKDRIDIVITSELWCMRKFKAVELLVPVRLLHRWHYLQSYCILCYWGYKKTIFYLLSNQTICKISPGFNFFFGQMIIFIMTRLQSLINLFHLAF